jgi:hypothetical protein
MPHENVHQLVNARHAAIDGASDISMHQMTLGSHTVLRAVVVRMLKRYMENANAILPWYFRYVSEAFFRALLTLRYQVVE